MGGDDKTPLNRPSFWRVQWSLKEATNQQRKRKITEQKKKIFEKVKWKPHQCERTPWKSQLHIPEAAAAAAANYGYEMQTITRKASMRKNALVRHTVWDSNCDENWSEERQNKKK